MGGFTVEEKEQLKALGFIIDPKGNWSLHVQQTAADARKRLGAIRRVAHLLDNQGIIMAYKAFVRSKIEYGNLVYRGAAYTNLGMPSPFLMTQSPPSCLVHWSAEERRRQLVYWSKCLMVKGAGG